MLFEPYIFTFSYFIRLHTFDSRIDIIIRMVGTYALYCLDNTML